VREKVESEASVARVRWTQGKVNEEALGIWWAKRRVAGGDEKKAE
jgi:hypothetical protein